MRKNSTVIGLIMLLCLFLTACGSSEERKNYKEAKMYYDIKLYEKAIPFYRKAGTYKDSEDKVLECQYKLALYDMEELRDYEKAVSLLSQLSKVSDGNKVLNSEEIIQKLNKCYYSIAEDYERHNDYDKAKAYFLKAEDYEDSAKRAEKCMELKKNQLSEYAEKVNKQLKKYAVKELKDLTFDSISKTKYGHINKVETSSVKFGELSNPDKLTIIEVIANISGLTAVSNVSLQCGDIKYTAMQKDRDHVLKEKGKDIYKRLIVDSPTNTYADKGSSTKKSSSSSSSGSGSSSSTSGMMCSKCHSKKATHGVYCDDCYYDEIADLADKGISQNEISMWANGYPEYDDAYYGYW